MEFLILRSRTDPDFYIITDEKNYHRAVQEYRDSQPGDELLDTEGKLGDQVLASIPNLSVVKSFIDLIGYFGHAMDTPKAWPTPAIEDEQAAG